MTAATTATSLGRKAWGAVGRTARRIRGTSDERPPPWESGILDDLADNRPWNLVTKAARRAALLRVRSLEDGVTVIVVNWNTLPLIQDVVSDVRRFSPPGTRLLLVDNASTDGSRAWLRTQDDLDRLLLPSNVGHAIALDLAMCRVRTKVAVTLDSDAFPLNDSWLDQAVEPVRRGEVVLCGLRASRDFVHPVYSAVDTATFLRRNLSFQVYARASVATEGKRWGENIWDTAELLTSRLDPTEVRFVDPTPNRAPDLPGMSTGDVVYHHGGVTRGTTGGMTDEALEGWKQARRALGVDA